MYFPKSQITSNLYTNGGEFILDPSGKEYIGFYFKTSKGDFYTGRNTSDRPNVKLIQVNEFYSESAKDLPQSNIVLSSHNPLNFDFININNLEVISKYSQIKNIDVYNSSPKMIPYYSPTFPNQQDYQNGEFQRYFCKKVNEILYIEINLEQYTKLLSQDSQIEFSLYKPFTISWVLTGSKEQVYKTNKNIVELISFQQKLPKFGDYLKFDYIKYYK